MPTGVASPNACVCASRSPSVAPGSDVGGRRSADRRSTLLHQRQVDHQPVVADRVAGDVVAAAAHGEQEVVVGRESDGVLNVGRAGAAGDQRRAPVDHGVPDRPRLVVAGVGRAEQEPRELLTELTDLVLGHACRGLARASRSELKPCDPLSLVSELILHIKIGVYSAGHDAQPEGRRDGLLADDRKGGGSRRRLMAPPSAGGGSLPRAGRGQPLLFSSSRKAAMIALSGFSSWAASQNRIACSG